VFAQNVVAATQAKRSPRQRVSTFEGQRCLNMANELSEIVDSSPAAGEVARKTLLYIPHSSAFLFLNKEIGV